MDPMMELVNALNALTAALQKFTSQTTNAYLATFEEIWGWRTLLRSFTAWRKSRTPVRR